PERAIYRERASSRPRCNQMQLMLSIEERADDGALTSNNESMTKSECRKACFIVIVWSFVIPISLAIVARSRSCTKVFPPSGAMDLGLTNPARAGMQQR